MRIKCVPVGPLQANCYLVSDEAGNACAVDPGGEPERLAKMLEKDNLSLSTILLTHGHFDHAEGVAGLAAATGALVCCSFETAPAVMGEQGCTATGMPIPSLDPPFVQVVQDGEIIECAGELLARVVTTPGHTPGDLTFEIGGHLFCGDLLFAGSVGRTDFPGGDFDTLLASIARLIRTYPKETPIHPGHMQSSTLGEELAHNPFLVGLRER
jgi:hydroxyacylglutathione hydrolase